MHWFSDVRLTNQLQLTILYEPELHLGIPACADEETFAVHLERVNIFDWLVVLTDSLGRLGRISWIPHFDCVV